MKPASLHKESNHAPSRRNLLLWLGSLGGALATMLVGVPVFATLLGPVIRRREDQWVDAGPIDDFPAGQMRLIELQNPLGQPRDGASAKASAYVRHTETGKFHVLSTRCTHLGCPVTWFEQSGLFMCPCHGGVYYADGAKAAGPPPRDLYSLPHRVRGNRLQIRLGHLPTLAEPT